MPKNIIKELTLTEISAVDRPAQVHAKAVLLKAAPKKTDGGKEYSASDFAYVPDPAKPSTWKLRLTSTPGGEPDAGIVGAAAAALGPGYRGQKVQIPSADRAKVVARVRAAWRKANPGKKDDEMPSGIAKADMLSAAIEKAVVSKEGESAETFAEALQEQSLDQNLWKIMDALRCSVRSIMEDDTLDTTAKGQAIRLSADQFVSTVQALMPAAMPSLVKALAGEIAGDPPSDERTEIMPDDTKKVADLEAQLADTKKALDTATAVMALKAEEKAHYDGLDETAKAAFLAKSESARATELAEKAAQNEVVYKSDDGAEFRKSDDPRLVQMAKDRDADRKAMKEATEKAELSEFTKAAEKDYGHLPGETVAKAKSLRAVSKLGKEDRDAIEAMLKAGEKAMVDAMKAVGSDGAGAGGDAVEKLDKLIKTEMTKSNVNYNTAYETVIKTDEGKALHDEQMQERRAA